MLHQGRCHKSCGVFGQILVYLMSRDAFPSKTKQNVQRPLTLDAACRLVKPNVFTMSSLKSPSNIWRASSSCQEMDEFSASAASNVVEHPVHIFHTHAPWTTFGISLSNQILFEGDIEVRNNTTKSYPAVRPL